MLSVKSEFRGLLAMAFLVEVGLFSACCASTNADSPPVAQKDHPVQLRVEKHNNKKRANAYPDTITVLKYAKGGPGRTVTWAFTHSDTSIQFLRDELPPPKCVKNSNGKGGKCILVLPDGLLPADQNSRAFKYVISGKDDSDDLEPNDPFVIIQR